MKEITVEHGETLQVRLPGGEFLTVYASPSGYRPMVQITAQLTDSHHHAVVEHREAAPGQVECGFIRIYEA